MNTEQFVNEFKVAFSQGDKLNVGYLSEAIGKLSQAITDFPKEPILYAYRAMAFELLEPSISVLPLKAANDYKIALELYQKMTENPSEGVRAAINVCIMYDKLRDGDALKSQLSQLSSVGDESYELWFALGTLCHKVGKYDQAIAYLDKAIIACPNDVSALIKKGYCLEGLVKLREAEQCFLDVLSLPTVGDVPDKDADAYGEACHGLGHIYTELGDRDNGIRYMKAARDLSWVYMCCFATIHSELKDYENALRLIDDAMKHPAYQNNPEGQHELIFYRGEAYSGLQMFAEADRDFGIFEKFSRQRNDTDAVAHAAIFQVKSYLRRNNLENISLPDLHTYLEKLQSSPLSPYANIFIHKEYDQLIEIIQAYIRIKNIMSQDNPEIGDVADVIGILRSAMIENISETYPILYLTNDHTIKPATNILELRSEADGILCDVWLVAMRKSIPQEHMVLIAKYAEERTIVVVGFDGLSLPESLLEDVVLIDDNLDAGVRLAELTLLLDRSRRYIAEVKPIYAMAPVKTAPSFVSAQAGDLFPLFLG